MSRKEGSMLKKHRLKSHQMDDKGFTLIELIITMAISAFIILGAYTLVMIGSKSYERTNKVTKLEQETTFASNILGEAIRSGNSAETLIWKPTGPNGDVVLYLGFVPGAANNDEQKRVFHYDSANHQLFVYLSEGEITDSDDLQAYIDKTDAEKDEHLMSKYIDKFDVITVSETDNSAPTDADYMTGTGVQVQNWSRLIRVTMTVQFKDKKDITDVIYQIRN